MPSNDTPPTGIGREVLVEFAKAVFRQGYDDGLTDGHPQGIVAGADARFKENGIEDDLDAILAALPPSPVTEAAQKVVEHAKRVLMDELTALAAALKEVGR